MVSIWAESRVRARNSPIHITCLGCHLGRQYGCRLNFFIKRKVLGFDLVVLGLKKRVLGFFSGVTKNVTWQSPRGKVEIGDLKDLIYPS